MSGTSWLAGRCLIMFIQNITGECYRFSGEHWFTQVVIGSHAFSKPSVLANLKGVPVNMSSFVFVFCVFPSSCNACYTGLLSDILPVMLESAN